MVCYFFFHPGNNQYKWTAGFICFLHITYFILSLNLHLFVIQSEFFWLMHNLFDAEYGIFYSVLFFPVLKPVVSPFSLNINTMNRLYTTFKNNINQSDITLYLPEGQEYVLSRNFIEWFRGFTDAERCFIILKHKTNVFSFNFIIELHIDDLDALEYIHNTLQQGKIIVYKTSNSARYIVNVHSEIAVIIAIFSKYNLNTTKHLNFLDFERAYRLYMDNSSLEARK
uniref:Homing endonuclease LAGLIDADG domain-containing protein n=1 Tax=Orbilia brochopaga TaxID=3140254 RepID=A0A4Y5MV77_9PEZI|nr:hypothetical protein [Drechslerella brochopaga]